MSGLSEQGTTLPPEQQAIRAKCFHPTETFVEFKKDEIEESIPKRFEEIAQMYPDRIAIYSNGRLLTYQALNDAANCVARAILQERSRDAEPVGLLFETDTSLMTAMLGVLKAGKFFILLDRSHPKMRLSAVLDHSQAKCVITERRHTCLARQVATTSCCLMELESIDGSNFSMNNPSLGISPDANAFLAYTSGSTGKPKGVVQNHRNVLHDIMLRTNAYHICPQDRISLLGSGTSHAIKNAFFALLNGAALLPFDVKKQGLISLATWLRTERISICRITIQLFRTLCEVLARGERLPDLRLLQFAGDSRFKTDVDLWKKYFSPGCILANGISSSETGFLTDYLMDHETLLTADESPAGYAVEDKEILILDEAGRELGFNQVGEIVVRSQYLSPGYWQQPDLTKEKFKPDPKSGSERLYFTGDLGVRVLDGSVMHKGRKDFRVQIRGYGVDIFEIEKTLRRYDPIREAIVIARQNNRGEKRLVAYFTTANDAKFNVSKLRSFLKEKLPDYMVPSAFIRLHWIPLTTNGKVDRTALPDPDNVRPDLETAFVAPRTPTEKKLVEIWAEVLGTDRVGIHDDFFDLGGHSLLATHLFTRIEKAFGKHLAPTTILHASTVEQLATILREETRLAPWSLMAPIQTEGSKPPFFWVWKWNDTWIRTSLDVRLERHLDTDQPLYWLLHQCHGGKRAAYSRLEDIAAHHLKEILTVQPHGPYFLGGIDFGGMVVFEMAQQLHEQGQQVAMLFLLDPAAIQDCTFLVKETPSCRKPLSKITSFRDNVFRHLHNLVLLAPKDRLTYVLVRMKGVIGAMGASLAKDIASNVCWISGYPLSRSLRRYNFSKVNHQIIGNYKPRRYSGPVTVIKAKDSSWDPQLIRTLVDGNLEIHEVPGNQHDMTKEPHAQTWAIKLKHCLSQAQANAMSQNRHVQLNDDRPDYSAMQ